jgi:uncharacterized membrane protein YphA (DoxX/SURF4 family)
VPTTYSGSEGPIARPARSYNVSTHEEPTPVDVIVLAARLLFVAIFVEASIGHLGATTSAAAYAKAKGVPAPTFSVMVSGGLMAVGSVSVVLGAWGDAGALLLAAAVLPIPIYMHAYWREEGEARANEMAHFYKTVSVLGGAIALFALFAVEPGLGLTVTGPLFTA